MASPGSSKLFRESLYERGIARVQRRLARGEVGSQRLSRARVAFVASSALVILLLYRAAWFQTGNALVALALIAFVLIARYHARLVSRLARLRIWIELKENQLARRRVDWPNIAPRVFPHPPHHPYAADLHLTGTHSLLGLIDLTVSSGGQKRLIEWFLNQNENRDLHDSWADRQALIKDLAPLTLLRDRLIVEARMIGTHTLDTSRIIALIQTSRAIPRAGAIWGSLLLLCAMTWSLLFATGILGIPNYWLLSLGAYTMVYFATAGQLKPLFDCAQDLRDELRKLHAVTSLIERRRDASRPSLRKLCAPLVEASDRVSQIIVALARICHGLSIKVHPVARLLVNALVPWDWFFSVRLQRTGQRMATVLPVWLDRLSTLDAAMSLATFASLNPEYCWPVLRAQGHGGAEPGLSARGLGHPLIPASRRVGNDLDLHGLGRILLITGSNMSGKSTFLRTVGINVCLAQAGAPVCAERFEWSWFRVFCCISVSDSLEDGLSYFYTEVKRLKALLDAAQDRTAPPVLFLIDEIFKGTNNRERLSGSRAFIEALQRSHGLGLISTHDLELAQLERESNHITNAHFQETIESGRLRFDYRLRPGVCPTTNALRIMAHEGLPVPTDQSAGRE